MSLLTILLLVWLSPVLLVLPLLAYEGIKWATRPEPRPATGDEADRGSATGAEQTFAGAGGLAGR